MIYGEVGRLFGRFGKVLKFNNIYQGKNVLVTGHTGFKGSWLSIWLNELGANVIGYSLDPYTDNDNYVLSKLDSKILDIRGDVRDYSRLNEVFKKYNPDIVFHLAAQPIVRFSYENPKETYEINLMGTVNVLECIRESTNTKIGIMVTSDKCYENKEQLIGYKENDRIGGYDPYSSSKGCVELAISSWMRSFFNSKKNDSPTKSIASVRAGNVIGGGDWAADRIIPDCIRKLELKEPIEIRNPQAIRPWQHVLDPLYGYLLLGQKLFEEPNKYCGGWNFGPAEDTLLNVWDLAKLLITKYGMGELLNMSNYEQLHEANLLTLDICKAKEELGWEPKINITGAIELTVEWYKKYKTHNMYNLCVDQINNYGK
ncbi:CDP-glucose 4,6-dehydratase [Bacillus toyonensis]|nr:CDP-glucose 4,6-dehydratase [Bacillus toyonensis]